MLNDDDALESAYEPLCDPFSEGLVDAGRRFSSCTALTPLRAGGLRPKGLRKGAIVNRMEATYTAIFCAIICCIMECQSYIHDDQYARVARSGIQ